MAINAQFAELVGSCSAASDGSTTSPTGFRTGMVQSITKGGAGTYTINLSPGVDSQEVIARGGIRAGAAQSNLQIAYTSDTALTVTTFVAAVATDLAFDLQIWRVRTIS